MNRTVTTKEAILAASKEIIVEKGMQSLNMREVATRCGVALGSVYNYFPSKEDLVGETVVSIWEEIMHKEAGIETKASFTDTVRGLFDMVHQGSQKYPNFLSVHAMSFAERDRKKGREIMNRFFRHIEKGLMEALERDPEIKQEAFRDALSKPAFIGFVFSSILNLVMNGKTECEILLAIIRRTIYE